MADSETKDQSAAVKSNWKVEAIVMIIQIN